MPAPAPRRITRLRIVGLVVLVLGFGLAVFIGIASRTVRRNAQTSVITCNLAQLQAAAEQFCLENHRLEATYDDVVGPGKWISADLQPVAGEDYRSIKLRAGGTATVRTRDGREFSYTPKSGR